MDEKRYVVGFMFRRDFKEVALIRKLRPDWQMGMFNGIGGKVEPGETPTQSMIREFKEEAGFTIEKWEFYAATTWNGGFVHYFTCIGDGADLRSETAEQIDWVDVSDLQNLSVIPDLKWAIPMAILRHKEAFFAHIDYSVNPAAKQIDK